jgi:hypothetical protein
MTWRYYPPPHPTPTVARFCLPFVPIIKSAVSRVRGGPSSNQNHLPRLMCPRGARYFPFFRYTVYEIMQAISSDCYTSMRGVGLLLEEHVDSSVLFT